VTEADLRRKITLDAIKKDARYAGRYVGSSGGSTSTVSLAPIAHIFIFSHFSAFIHESREKWGYVRGGRPPELSPAVIEIIEKSRNSLKYLEGGDPDVGAMLKDFDAEVIQPARADYLPQFGTDLGIFRYQGQIYSTTHSAAFGLGIPFSRLGSPYIRDVATDYGKYFREWGAKIEDTKSFLNYLDEKYVGQEENRVSSDFYGHTFNGNGPEALNAFVVLLHSALTFSNLLLVADPQEDSFHTTFKLRYLTLYHAVRSVQALIGLREPGVALSTSSRTYMQKILSLPLAKLIVKNNSNPSALRRSLIHYAPEDRFMAEVSLSEPLYGLLGAAFPESTFDDSVECIYACSVAVAEIFAEWRGGSTDLPSGS
jgi:hypothetical protein